MRTRPAAIPVQRAGHDLAPAVAGASFGEVEVFTAGSPPSHCPSGHRLSGNRVVVNYVRCGCDKGAAPGAPVLDVPGLRAPGHR